MQVLLGLFVVVRCIDGLTSESICRICLISVVITFQILSVESLGKGRLAGGVALIEARSYVDGVARWHIRVLGGGLIDVVTTATIGIILT